MGICLTPAEPKAELDNTQTSDKINTYNSNVYIFKFT
jgi:hypothetical protein